MEGEGEEEEVGASCSLYYARLEIVLTARDPDVGPDILGDYDVVGWKAERHLYRRVLTPDRWRSVYMYFFYDTSPKDLYTGWWISEEVDGDIVFGHAPCRTNSVRPPESGWRVPYGGPVVQALSIVTAYDRRGQLEDALAKARDAEKVAVLEIESLQRKYDKVLSRYVNLLNKSNDNVGGDIEPRPDDWIPGGGRQRPRKRGGRRVRPTGTAGSADGMCLSPGAYVTG